MAHSFTHLLTHVVFSTKDRRPQIDAELRPRLFACLGGIVRELNGKALAIGGTADHVQLLILLPATVSLADALRVLKTNSSRWVHKKWSSRRAFAWQSGYGAFAVSQSDAAPAMKYIAGQELHHKKISFQEEFLRFLEKHRMPYDIRYLWD